jgi:hypothetical protein
MIVFLHNMCRYRFQYYPVDDEFELTINEKEVSVELSCDTSLKHKYHNESLIQFWLDINIE